MQHKQDKLKSFPVRCQRPKGVLQPNIPVQTQAVDSLSWQKKDKATTLDHNNDNERV